MQKMNKNLLVPTIYPKTTKNVKNTKYVKSSKSI